MRELQDFLGNKLSPGDFVVRANKNDFKFYIVLGKYSDDQVRVGNLSNTSRVKNGKVISGIKLGRSIVATCNLCKVTVHDKLAKAMEYYRDNPNDTAYHTKLADVETLRRWAYGYRFAD